MNMYYGEYLTKESFYSLIINQRIKTEYYKMKMHICIYENK